MVIMALWESADHGKTATLGLLLNKVNGDARFSKITLGKGEGAFQYGDKKIAITTAGDSKGILEEFFTNYPDCDFYVCASRSKGQTVEYLKEKAKGNLLIWYGKTSLGKENRDETKGIFDELNERQAEYLFNELVRLITKEAN